MATLSILGVSALLVILIQITLVDAAQGLTRYYNCVTGIRTIKETFSFADVEICYDYVSKTAQNADDDCRPLIWNGMD